MAKVSKKEPLISVIVPVYNSQTFINECIDSLIAQTYKNLEIIIVNDGSTDESGKICDEYAKKDDRIKVYHNKNNGVSYTRNFGISKANGDYIGFIDSDDYISKDMYKILLNNCIENNADISICDVSREDNSFICNQKKQIILYNQQDYIKKYFRIGSQTCEYYPVNKLYKKSIIDSNLFPSEYHEGEDAFAILKTILRSQLIVYCPLNLYYYRKNENSATAHFSDTDWELIDVWDDIVEYVKETQKDYIDYAILNRKRLNFTILMRMSLNISPKELKKDKRAQKLLNELKKDEKYLLNSSIKLNRKILIFLFCRNFKFISSILYLLKK